MEELEYRSGAVKAGECISEAWALVTAKIGIYIGAGLLTILLISCIPIANFFLMGPVLGGFYYLVLRDYQGEPIEFGMLFKGFERFLPLMVVGVVMSIPAIVLTILQYTIQFASIIGGRGGTGAAGPNFFQAGLPFGEGFLAVFIVVMLGVMLFVILWHLAFIFAIPLVMDRNASIGDAIVTSLKAFGANIGGLILLAILQWLVLVAGALVICVGLLVAFPVAYAATAIAYRQVFPDLFRPSGAYEPPPPDAYGFGRRV